MVNNKEYRIPKIEEFVDGFVYEIYSDGCWEDGIEDFCGWYEYTVGKNSFRDIDEIRAELEDKTIRVKRNI